MESQWKECETCTDRICCKSDIAHPLFLTEEDTKRVKDAGFSTEKLNKVHPCPFFNSDGRCDIYQYRPFDCRIFPFDVHLIDGKFHWILWEVPCPIASRTDVESCLQILEKEIVPWLKRHLEEYNSFRNDEMTGDYSFKVLRPIKGL